MPAATEVATNASHCRKSVAISSLPVQADLAK